MKYSIAIVGAGNIARDWHVPSIAANSNFELVVAAVTTSRTPRTWRSEFRDYSK
jgi:predicted dehydrogenase